jgi:hypothetical protein
MKIHNFDSFLNEAKGRSGFYELAEFDSAFEGMLGALKAGGVPAETVSKLTDAYTTFVNKTRDILSLAENTNESSYSGDISGDESKDAFWHVSEAFRKDGAHAALGASYKDGNNRDYTIDDMWIADNGKLMGHAAEGGAIDLGVANFKEPVAFGRREYKK